MLSPFKSDNFRSHIYLCIMCVCVCIWLQSEMNVSCVPYQLNVRLVTLQLEYVCMYFETHGQQWGVIKLCFMTKRKSSRTFIIIYKIRNL